MKDHAAVSRLLKSSLPFPRPEMGEGLPFRSEEEFWEIARFRFGLLQLLRSVVEARTTDWEVMLLRNRYRVFENRRMSDDPTEWPPNEDLESILSLTEPLLTIENLLREEEERWRSAVAARISLSSEVSGPPRILRLADRLDLCAEDLDILSLIVLLCSEHEFGPKSSLHSGKAGVRRISSLLRLSTGSFFLLLSGRHPLCAHELVSLEADGFGRWTDAELRMDKSVAKLLRGLDLDNDDLLSIEEGVLQELLKEGGFHGPLAPENPLASGPEPPVLLDVALESDVVGDVHGRPEFDIDAFIQDSLGIAPAEASADAQEETESSNAPYRDDLEYLTHHLEWFGALGVLRGLEEEDTLRSMRNELSPAARRREARGRARSLRSAIDQRVALTREAGGWLPRAEILAESRRLEDFEKHLVIFLAAKRASTRFDQVMSQGGGGRLTQSWTVGSLLHLFFDDLPSQVKARRFFYRDASLIRDQILNLSRTYVEDLLEAGAEIDRRMTDFLLGLDLEGASQVEGSVLYTPRVSLGQVCIPDVDKNLIVQTVEQFPAFQRARRNSGLEDLIAYGGGIVLLFHGPSGTGKTMMANALGQHLGKRIFLINVEKASESELRWVFREAKIQDCILFFDECEAIFGDRQFNLPMTGLLSEIERHDGLVILATNRPWQLDEAMHRRIILEVEFRKPDVALRERIWQTHQPPNLGLDGELDFWSLAFDHELTGGLIKNAWVAALALATARDSDCPRISQADLEAGARQQLRGGLQLSTMEDRIIPKKHLDDLVLPQELKASLRELVGREKARKTLIGQWGFDADENSGLGTKGLFHGPPGTGKTAAAEAVATQLGRVLKRVNAGQVVSKWVGEGAKNIQAIFGDAHRHDAVLLFDEADALFGGRTGVASSTDRYANLETSVLLQALESFNGVLILTTNLLENVDSAFVRRLGFVLEFPMPDEEAREEIWRITIPARLPVSDDLRVRDLASMFPLSGAQIRNAVVKAASRAALRNGDARRVHHGDFLEAAREETRIRDRQGKVGF